MTVFDAIKNGIASAVDPFKQFHGVAFEQSSLAKLSPVWVRLFNIAHLSVLYNERSVSVNSFVCKRLHGIWAFISG